MKVGLLLPLTGPHADLGLALQNAAQMAVFDDASAPITLMPRDTGEDPQQAVRAFQELAAQGASLVIGPLFAGQVSAIKPIAQQQKLPLLAFSNDSSLAAPGVYLLGYSPAQQVARVTGFACAKGSRRFAALLPNNGYGNLVNDALQDAMRRCSGAGLDVKRYDAAGDGLARGLQDIAAQRQLIDTLALAAPADAFAATPLPLALDGRHIRLLGTALWNETAQAGRQAPTLVGGWFAMPDGGDRDRFTRNYQAAYGSAPPALASLAYDAVALAGALERQPAAQRNLNSTTGYKGVDGIFRLLPDGTVERGLSVSRITATGRDVLDRAPASFAGATH